MNDQQKITIGAVTAVALAVGVYVLAKKYHWSCRSFWNRVCSCCNDGHRCEEGRSKPAAKSSASHPKYSTQSEHSSVSLSNLPLTCIVALNEEASSCFSIHNIDPAHLS